MADSVNELLADAAIHHAVDLAQYSTGVVRRIIALTGQDESLIAYVDDRPGHDRRYSLSSAKVRALGWEPKMRFEAGLLAVHAVVLAFVLPLLALFARLRLLALPSVLGALADPTRRAIVSIHGDVERCVVYGMEYS